MSDPATRERPVSPYVTVWRWHIGMATSITNRIALFGVYAGVLILVGWLWSLASGRESYAAYTSLLATPVGVAVLVAISAGVFFSTGYKVRRLVMDLGHCYSPRASEFTGAAVFGFTIVATIGFWAVVMMKV
ncbi:succinate dehydrogenase, cytochrome b556 subunit [Caulobacter sp. BK020]|uniref:succinate dehydrogenase, cytochrome b556 subunit n=1 Tax=Caulobacter sp. BK020 TaxID=2512117 RepID=UPI001050583F|nr:succinate dehydrogenase, cytochrome b556 subunit [Caulobacter sp. BK020]TCS17334.1 succinate dehydrogenase subunit C [Caulobacter sp. BK020]